LCVFWFFLFVCFLCPVCPVLPVDLDCPFSIVPSVFSYVYYPFICLLCIFSIYI
jgi:hypothetical protein